MPLELGSAFIPRRPVVEPDEPRQPSADDLRSEHLLAALAQLHEALSAMPAPVVNVAEPDLSAIVTAVTQLKGSATPEEIARAVVGELGGDTREPIEPILERLVESLERLDFRMKGMGASGGPILPASMDISDRNDRVLGQVSTVLADNRTLTERMMAKAPTVGHSLWLDTADATYIYIAEAPSTEVSTGTQFRGVRIVKDAAGNPLGKVQIAQNFAWDSRASAGWL